MGAKYDDIKKCFSWIKEKNLHWIGLAFIMSLYIYVGYEHNLVNEYNACVMPLLEKFTANIWSIIATLVLCAIAGYDIYTRARNRYQFDCKVVFCLLWLIILILKYRVSGNYTYVSFIWIVSYVDAFLFIAASYLTLAVVNRIRLYVFLNKKGRSEEVTQKTILRDWPIEDKSEDIFDLQGEAAKIADEIRNLDRRKTWSLAITAPWGTGKTSFLNLIVKEVGTEKFEFLCFNPRDSKSYKSIQEDFFTQISCILSKYDSRCNSVLKDYMASLQLIDNRGVVEKLVNFYKIWNKDDLKDSLKSAFSSLEKKVIVLIDDFDRLSKDEIMEVLKLIDSNAAFSNLVFLTAYDKAQVNKALGPVNNTDDACFVDKFFNLEFSIPARPYVYITQYIEDSLVELTGSNQNERRQFGNAIKSNVKYFRQYLPTLRDAKRYVNQVVLDYKRVRGDVNVSEYLLINLIKYKYPESYKSIYRQEYTEKGGLFADNNVIYLRNDLDEKLDIYPVLKDLFPSEKNLRGVTYRHIYDSQSFDNYFVNQIYSSMRIRDMEQVFYDPFETACSKVNDWISDESKCKDIIDYMSSFDMDNFPNGAYYIRYAQLNAYLAVKMPSGKAYWLYLKMIYLNNLDGYDKRYGLNVDQYKTDLLSIITNENNDTSFSLLRSLHMAFVTLELKEEEELITDNDIWPILKEAFIRVAKVSETDDSLTSWLYKCVDHMEQPSGRLVLDTDCISIYKQRVEANPLYYIKSFVRLGGVSSSLDFNSVACEPSWQQIWGDSVSFKTFLDDCVSKGVEGSAVAKNFWKLYEANDYKPIEYSNQGSVQAKIDNNLVDEVAMLDQLVSVEHDIDEVSTEPSEEGATVDVQSNLELLDSKEKELSNIRLYIALNGKIREKIESKRAILHSLL